MPTKQNSVFSEAARDLHSQALACNQMFVRARRIIMDETTPTPQRFAIGGGAEMGTMAMA